MGFDNILPSSGSLSLTKLLVCLILLFPFLSFSQVGVPIFPSQTEIDSLNTSEVDTAVIEPLDLQTVEAEMAFLKEKYRKDYKPLIAMDNHYTAFFGHSANFWGLKVGLELFQGYRMGFGAYYMPKKVAIDPVFEEGARDTIYRKFRMHYYNTFMEFVFIRDFRWELALPFSLGYGIAEVERWSPRGHKWVEGKDIGMFVGNFSLNGHYKIFSWVGLGLGFGWRQVISSENEVQENMSGLTLSYKVKLFPHHLYRALFNKQKILEEKGDYRYQKYLKKQYKRLKREEARRLHDERKGKR